MDLPVAARAGMAIAGLHAAVERHLSEWVRARLAMYGLIAAFALSSVERVLGAFSHGTFFIDLRVYREAALVALNGGDPWIATAGQVAFAAPPPTLLAYFPAAFVPEPVAIAVYLGVSVLACFVALRAARCPMWWFLFPPLLDSLVVLNPDVLVIALLLATPRLAGLAIVLKVYAAIPLLIMRRWRSLVVGGLLCLLSAPWWAPFLAHRDEISIALEAQAFGGMSAWGTWLMAPTVVALVVLRRHGAEWLLVPALWPFTQLHYSAIALPVAARSPMVAFLLSFAVAYLPPIATIAYAVVIVGERLAAPYRDVRPTPAPVGG